MEAVALKDEVDVVVKLDALAIGHGEQPGEGGRGGGGLTVSGLQGKEEARGGANTIGMMSSLVGGGRVRFFESG